MSAPLLLVEPARTGQGLSRSDWVEGDHSAFHKKVSHSSEDAVGSGTVAVAAVVAAVAEVEADSYDLRWELSEIGIGIGIGIGLHLVSKRFPMSTLYKITHS